MEGQGAGQAGLAQGPVLLGRLCCPQRTPVSGPLGPRHFPEALAPTSAPRNSSKVSGGARVWGRLRRNVTRIGFKAVCPEDPEGSASYQPRTVAGCWAACPTELFGMWWGGWVPVALQTQIIMRAPGSELLRGLRGSLPPTPHFSPPLSPERSSRAFNVPKDELVQISHSRARKSEAWRGWATFKATQQVPAGLGSRGVLICGQGCALGFSQIPRSSPRDSKFPAHHLGRQ